MDKEDLAIVHAYDTLLRQCVDVPEALAQVGAQFGIVNFDVIDDLYDEWLADGPDMSADSMDGDHASAFASIGWGTDEDYGGTDERY